MILKRPENYGTPAAGLPNSRLQRVFYSYNREALHTISETILIGDGYRFSVVFGHNPCRRQPRVTL